MLSELFTNHGSAVFMVAFTAFVLSCVMASGRKFRRKEKLDPPPIFGPIRGMYVCYQCDTIFNTALCPNCNEEASIPLIHLTGSIQEDERVAAITNRIKTRGDWKLSLPRGEQAVPASLPNPANGNGKDSSEVPVTLLFSPQ
ncbi:MAG: hypothetical protein ACP5SH_04930, partial [Syntrophobacteraceae bacterium]